jgi:hypothetical protein
MPTPRLPDFFVIGASKSGTTSLWNHLDQHPDIFMCRPKEPQFMGFGEQAWPYTYPGAAFLKRFKAVMTLPAYQALFVDAGAGQLAGEASVSSLDVARSAARIKHYAPQAKLIAILRHPADRAFSHYNMVRRSSDEPIADFRAALAAEPDRIASGWWPGYHYRKNGLYAQNLSRYFELFERQRIRVVLNDDLNAKPHDVMRNLYGFLDVNDAFVPDLDKRFNEGGNQPKNETLFRLARDNRITRALRRHAQPLYQPLKGFAKAAMTKPAVLDPALRDELTQDYRDDILRLQDMIDRDLSHWLKPVANPLAAG